VVISPRFGDIFRGNSLKGGMLTITLSEKIVEQLWSLAEQDPAAEVTVDLERREVRFAGETTTFELDEYARMRLLEGLDDVALTLRHADAIAAFEDLRPDWSPRTIAS